MTATKNTPEKPAEANPFGPRVALGSGRRAPIKPYSVMPAGW